jgi:hypothetical protein
MPVLISSRRIVATLALIAAGIVGVHVFTLVLGYGFDRDNVFGLTRLFDVDGEDNVPAFFSFGLLLFAGVLLSIITLRQPRGARPRRALWAGLALVFFYLAADEGFELHERVSKIAARVLGTHELSYYAWVAPYALGALIFGVVYARFLGQLPRPIRIRFLASGTVYVAGALGAEVAGAIYVHYRHTEHALGYDIETAIEESLEMAGVIVFIYALAKYLEHQAATRSLSEPREDEQATS